MNDLRVRGVDNRQAALMVLQLRCQLPALPPNDSLQWCGNFLTVLPVICTIDLSTVIQSGRGIANAHRPISGRWAADLSEDRQPDHLPSGLGPAAAGGGD